MLTGWMIGDKSKHFTRLFVKEGPTGNRYRITALLADLSRWTLPIFKEILLEKDEKAFQNLIE
jgi:hypothetical protein